jgi:hypothetical protein
MFYYWINVSLKYENTRIYLTEPVGLVETHSICIQEVLPTYLSEEISCHDEIVHGFPTPSRQMQDGIKIRSSFTN